MQEERRFYVCFPPENPDRPDRYARPGRLLAETAARTRQREWLAVLAARAGPKEDNSCSESTRIGPAKEGNKNR